MIEARKAKIIFLGDSTVGKSSIISAINHADINSLHEPTIGIDFYTKCCMRNRKEYKLQFWDTAGQEKFRSIMPSYVRNSNMVVLVYDTTNTASFENLEKWFEFLENCASESIKIIVVGNKIDLETQRKVETSQAEQKMKEKGLKYKQVSAKNREGVEQLLQDIVGELDDVEVENKECLDIKRHFLRYTCCKY